jgi:uncharacterized protein YecE (DUF72 family)
MRLYYTFPSEKYLNGLVSQVPNHFQFGFKVTDEITVRKTFQPYDKTKEINEEARQAGRALIVEGEQYKPRRKTYIYVNNRLEGNALETIAAMLEAKA